MTARWFPLQSPEVELRVLPSEERLVSCHKTRERLVWPSSLQVRRVHGSIAMAAEAMVAQGSQREATSKMGRRPHPKV